MDLKEWPVLRCAIRSHICSIQYHDMLKPLRLLIWLGLVLATTCAVIVMIGRMSPDEPASPSRQLRVGYAIEAPYAFRDIGGGLHGESVDVLRAALRRLGRPEPIWIHAEFPTLLHELRMGRIDVIAAGLFVTPARAAQVALTRPTAAVQPALLVGLGNPEQLHALQDLVVRPRLRLAVIDRSVEAGQALEAGMPDERLLRLPDAAGGLDAVRSGRAAAFMLSAPALQWALAQPGTPAGELARPFSPPTGSSLGLPALAMRRGDPLRDQIDQVLATYVGSQEHLELVRQYGFRESEIAPVRGTHPPGDPATDAEAER